MNKLEFLDELQKKLYGLPKEDIDDRVCFYEEMIDDRIEEGMSETDAIASLGNSDDIAAEIIAKTPLSRIVKEKIKPKRTIGTMDIVLIVLGSPIWITLLAVAYAVVISVYAVLWSGIVSVWAVFVSLCGVAFGGIIGGVIVAFQGYIPVGIALVGCSVVCAGLAAFAFFGCLAATKGGAWLTKKIVYGIKRCFIRKGRAK